MSLHLLIPAAGGGERLSAGRPKALVEISGRPLLALAAMPFARIPIDRAVVLAPPGFEEALAVAIDCRWEVRTGGASRAESVEIGLARLAPADGDFVIIHDAARPFVSREEIEQVIAAAVATGAAIAVIPIADTLKRVSGEIVSGTIDRGAVVAAATPQVFRADLLLRALASTSRATDEAGRFEEAGIPVAAVRVSRQVFKITFPEDVELAEAIFAWRQRHRRPRSA